MIKHKTRTATALLLVLGVSAGTAQAAPSDSEAWNACQQGIEARLGAEARIDLRRIRKAGKMIRVQARVRGLDDGPSTLECRIDREGHVVALFDPKAPAGSEFAAAP